MSAMTKSPLVALQTAFTKHTATAVAALILFVLVITAVVVSVFLLTDSPAIQGTETDTDFEAQNDDYEDSEPIALGVWITLAVVAAVAVGGAVFGTIRYVWQKQQEQQEQDQMYLDQQINSRIQVLTQNYNSLISDESIYGAYENPSDYKNDLDRTLLGKNEAGAIRSLLLPDKTEVGLYQEGWSIEFIFATMIKEHRRIKYDNPIMVIQSPKGTPQAISISEESLRAHLNRLHPANHVSFLDNLINYVDNVYTRGFEL